MQNNTNAKHKIIFSLTLPPSHSQPWSPLVSLAAVTVAALTRVTVNRGSLCRAHPFNPCCPGKVPPGTICCHIIHWGPRQQVLRAVCLSYLQQLGTCFKASWQEQQPCWGTGHQQPWSWGARAVLVLRVSVGCSALAGCWSASPNLWLQATGTGQEIKG